MNDQYLYEDETIGINEHNIDLLRNHFVYDKIEYQDIKSAKIEKGLPKNWIVQLTVGLMLVFSSFLIVIFVKDNSAPGDFFSNLLTFWRSSRGAGLLAVLFLLSFGIYIILHSVEQTLNLTIETDKFKKTFDIRDIDKKRLTDSLIAFLKERIDKIIIDERITQPNSK
ncbi:MAG: hypothetical protein K8R67_17415 [Desulfobacteraceae bacterium]|nr:hypothetical protein [Desulfobacteraceae bacterium]